jgi:ubiquinone/menaquinone biosynthesis C-methylase UbiE
MVAEAPDGTSAVNPTLQFDEEASRRVEAIYSTPDVVAQRQAVREALDVKPGERVLDIGAGPGFLAAELAASAAPTGAVLGTDISKAMLAIAAARLGSAGGGELRFEHADACALPCTDESFDAVAATQVYEYVEDIAAALSELARVLRPGGRALVLDTDWDSIVWHSGDPLRMGRVLDAWGEHLIDPHLPRRLIDLLKEAGLTVELCRVVPILNLRSNRNTYSEGMTELIADFVPGRQGLTEADAIAWSEDLNRLSRSGDYFFSLNRYLFLATKR